jgi:ribonuclease HI
MKANAPHFVLFSESLAASAARDSGDAVQGPGEPAPYWHFVLRTEEGSVALDACDAEADASVERLALWAVVRGLEAIPEPARVTLVTTSGWIRRGLRFGLDSWREHQWQWECFGRMTPIKNADLWQRVDRALRFHEVDCRTIRIDRPSDDLSRPVPPSVLARRDGGAGRTSTSPEPPASTSPRPSVGSVVRGVLRSLFLRCGLCGTDSRAVITAH